MKFRRGFLRTYLLEVFEVAEIAFALYFLQINIQTFTICQSKHAQDNIQRIFSSTF